MNPPAVEYSPSDSADRIDEASRREGSAWGDVSGRSNQPSPSARAPRSSERAGAGGAGRLARPPHLVPDERANPPDLSEEQILAWAEAHRRRGAVAVGVLRPHRRGPRGDLERGRQGAAFRGARAQGVLVAGPAAGPRRGAASRSRSRGRPGPHRRRDPPLGRCLPCRPRRLADRPAPVPSRRPGTTRGSWSIRPCARGRAACRQARRSGGCWSDTAG